MSSWFTLRTNGLIFFMLLFLTAEGQLSGVTVNDCPSQLNRGGHLLAYRRRCYDVVTYETLSWDDARGRCQRNGGMLADIGDQSTLDILAGYLSTLDDVGTGVWIGLNDKDIEGTWRWDSGASSGFRHWGSGQPGGIWGSIDDCAVMKLDGFWYDYACDVFFEHFGYICQYDVTQ